MLIFQHRVFAELEREFGKDFIKNDPKLILRDLEAAAEKEDEVAVSLSLTELKIYLITLFQNRQKDEMAQFLVQASEFMIKNLEKPLFNVVKASFTSALKSRVEDMAFKSKILGDSKPAGLLARNMLEALKLYRFGLNCNMTAQEVTLFKEEVRRCVEDLTQVISTPQSLAATIYCGLADGTRRSIPMEARCFGYETLLEVGFQIKG